MKLFAINGGYCMVVVRAPSEHDARQLLANTKDDMGCVFFEYGVGDCIELTTEGPMEIITECSE